VAIVEMVRKGDVVRRQAKPDVRRRNSVGQSAGPRWGLCCQFADAPIRFRTTTATALSRLSRRDRVVKLANLCRSNAQALLEAIRFCDGNGIGCFRINSQILPLKTHPTVGYEMGDLSDSDSIVSLFREAGALAAASDIRLTFHPDQFVVLNSNRPDVVASSIAELNAQAEVAEWVGADVINIHAGGGYGDKPAALRVLMDRLERLAPAVRSRITLENDDTVFTPADLLPICGATGIPLVYDVHHHRCLADGLNVEEATVAAISTWNREPLFHISSPLDGWEGRFPRRHHDFVKIDDFPACWADLRVTIEVEAKAKEHAIARLRGEWATAFGGIRNHSQKSKARA
jgi:UV DNA damage endonuclease